MGPPEHTPASCSWRLRRTRPCCLASRGVCCIFLAAVLGTHCWLLAADAAVEPGLGLRQQEASYQVTVRRRNGSFFTLHKRAAGQPQPAARRSLNAAAGAVAGAPGPATTTSTAACPVLSEEPHTTGTCECPNGWEGPNCGVCTGNAACVNQVGVSASTCSTSFNYTNYSQVKTYACQLPMSGVTAIIQQDSFYLTCDTGLGGSGLTNRTGLSGNAAANGPKFCDLHLALTSAPAQDISCRVGNCTFTANSPDVECQTLNCTCPSGCPEEAAALLPLLNNKTSRLSCSDATQQCTLDITGFFAKLSATCRAGDCQVPVAATQDLSAGSPPVSVPSHWNTIIPYIPLAIIAALAALALAYLWARRAYFLHRPAPAAHGIFEPFKPGSSGQRMETLEFLDIRCVLPEPKRRKWLTLHRHRSTGVAMPSSPSTSTGAGEEAAGKELGGAAIKIPWAKQSEAEELAEAKRFVADLQRGEAGEKLVLGGISGQAHVQELVGVLGPSGSGKTTLLSILADRTSELGASAALSGTVSVDGSPRPTWFRSAAAFVAQQDCLLPALTVAECVRYSALLRLPASMPAPEVQARVDSIMAELNLVGIAHSPVGGSGHIRGISGGERRRVSIAMELVTDPAALFLDEPTSGLDSFAALSLMHSLKRLAAAGRIVVLSFHQPSPAMYALLDRAFVMALGRCVWAGPPAEAAPFLAAQDLPLPPGDSVPEHLLNCVSSPLVLRKLLAVNRLNKATSNKSVAGEERLGDTPLHAYTAEATTASAATLDMEAPPAVDPIAQGESGPLPLLPGTPLTKPMAARKSLKSAPAPPKRSLAREFSVLFWRSGLDIARNPALLVMHWVTAIALGLFVGIIFLDVTPDTAGAQNRAGGIFFSLVFFGFASVTTVDLFINERRLVMREVRGGYYRPLPYLISKAVLDAVLLRIIPVLLYTMCFYPLMGLQGTAYRVALFIGMLSLFSATVGALSMAITTATTSAGKASLALNVLLLLSMLFGGLFKNVMSMKDWYGWLHYLSVFFYPFEAMVANEFTGLLFNFAINGYTAVSDIKGELFMTTLGLSVTSQTRDLIVLPCMYAAFIALAAFNLHASLNWWPALRSRTAAKQ